jgi:hypothetical protein
MQNIPTFWIVGCVFRKVTDEYEKFMNGNLSGVENEKTVFSLNSTNLTSTLS